MSRKKHRLYIALHHRNSKPGFHFALMLSPKQETRNTSVHDCHIYHTVNSIQSDVKFNLNGMPEWRYEHKVVNGLRDGTVIGRVLIAKLPAHEPLVTQAERIHDILAQVPLVQNDAQWDCRVWLIEPITKLHGQQLFDVWYQCIQCHKALWKNGVHHQDVSPPNLMWYKKDGKLIGVLNDYDLSSLATESGPRGYECTGTVPFMAIDLLTKRGQRGEVKHLYRHDLESFIWCFAWISLRYKAGVLRPRGSRPFDDWAILDAVTCGDKKTSLVTHKEVPDGTHRNDPGWQYILQFLGVLDTQASKRRLLLLQAASEADTVTTSEDEESETEVDIEDFLNSLKRTKAWAKLSNPSP